MRLPSIRPLESGAIRYFDCKTLADDVKRLIESGAWRFAKSPSEKVVRWALLGPRD